MGLIVDLGDGFNLKEVHHMLSGRPTSWYIIGPDGILFKFPTNGPMPPSELCYDIIALLKINAKMRKVLDKYADEENWSLPNEDAAYYIIWDGEGEDGFDIAREALE